VSDEPGLLWMVASVLGFLALVLAYMLNQTGRCQPSSPRYLAANVAGAGTMAAYSLRIDEPVLFALEGFWCVASAVALYRVRAASTSA